ncbi:hypothetical protein B0J12DRAFT_738109 [Macrophomina phaseolina]|uniref:Vacuolar ATPase assembly protein VMA22 n=1 Tax=Macrophomina phaseolina TaxID=35725 RepID=A0ABQ8GJP9_9PEZI|nr:hypothetical protein B0J12DRAFT_738109 [Macrophomina phaseolina]
MTDMLPTPRATPEAEEKLIVDDARAKLENSLDELLKQYLLLLDQYTQARQQLSSDLSAGFISLAQANFNASNRVRYGQDFYDERMQALRRVTIEENGAKLNRSIHLLDPPTQSTAKSSKLSPSKAQKTEKDTREEHSDIVSASIAKLDLDADADADTQTVPPMSIPEEGKEDDKSSKKQSKRNGQKSRPDDPIRWFGILVPPALRSAQGSFVRAVESSVPNLVDLAAEMRELEIEIGRTRKAIRKNGA